MEPQPEGMAPMMTHTQILFAFFALVAGGLIGCQSSVGPRVAVGPVEEDAPSVFAASIHPRLILDCAACHDYGRVLFSGQVAEDHAMILGLVDVSNPTASYLLQKATGEVGHPGGMMIDPNSDFYRLLVEWIGAGAP